MILKKKYTRLVLPALLALCFGNASAQVAPPVNEPVISMIDTLLKDSKPAITTSYNRDELNVYGFQATDIPTYTDEVYAYRMKQIETPISMDYNTYVRTYINLYAVNKRSLTSTVMGLSDYYFPMFEQVLEKNNLPLEFKYLSVIESALNPNAVSRCGATGLWQFMYSTGLQYGLTINSEVDERRDPLKATQAACDYFNNMYAIYHDWLLVIASYNCGPGTVNYAIKRAGGSYNFWDIQAYLPAETRGYVPAFLAVAYVMNYTAEHNLFPAEPDVKYQTEQVVVNKNISFYQISSTYGIPVSELEKLNPSFKKDYIPASDNKPQSITLPANIALRFTATSDIAYNATTTGTSIVSNPVNVEGVKSETIINAPAGSPENDIFAKGNYSSLCYKVKQGENLTTVCQKFSCRKDILIEWNKLLNEEVSEGQEIRVYVPKDNNQKPE